jgi:hypothetical protein
MKYRFGLSHVLAVAGILTAALGLAGAADGAPVIHVTQVGYRP